MEPRPVESLVDLLNNVRARGMSPLHRALLEAAGDFQFAPGRTNALVLIADGGDNCGEDPCQTVRFQRDGGIRYPIYVVGLGVEAAGRESLACLAQVSGGVYREAANHTELVEALEAFQNDILRQP